MNNLCNIHDYLEKVCIYLGESTVNNEIVGLRAVAELTGKRQHDDVFGHVYVDQHAGILGDDYSGFIYFPVPRADYLEDTYLKVSFNA